MPVEPSLPVEIRLARPADGDALGRAIKRIDCETDFLGEPDEKLPWADRGSEHLQTLAEQGSGVYVIALVGGEIVGFLGAFAGGLARNRGVIFIAHVGLLTPYRGRRIGGSLFAALEAWARTRGAHRLELMVVEDNARALALYHRQGFAIEGAMPDSFRANGRSHTGYLMGKLLVTGGAPPIVREPAAMPRGRPPATLAIRPLAAADWPALRLWEAAFLQENPRMLKISSELSPPERFETEIADALVDKQRLLLVATTDAADGTRIVGYATSWSDQFSRMAHCGYVIVCVLAAYRRRGIGRLLAGRLEDWARERRLSRLAAFALADNLAARCFAEATGYREEVRMRSYARIDDALVDRLRFGKVLAAPDNPM
jgi:RimJ/RimL family protein N-acetyltransferase